MVATAAALLFVASLFTALCVLIWVGGDGDAVVPEWSAGSVACAVLTATWASASLGALLLMHRPRALVFSFGLAGVFMAGCVAIVVGASV